MEAGPKDLNNRHIYPTSMCRIRHKSALLESFIDNNGAIFIQLGHNKWNYIFRAPPITEICYYTLFIVTILLNSNRFYRNA